MQNSAFGDVEVVTYIKVQKKNGVILYFKVVDGQNIEIDEATYLASQEE